MKLNTRRNGNRELTTVLEVTHEWVDAGKQCAGCKVRIGKETLCLRVRDEELRYFHFDCATNDPDLGWLAKRMQTREPSSFAELIERMEQGNERN